VGYRNKNTMFSESYRPQTLEEIIGHDEAKQVLKTYLGGNPRSKSVLVCGTPGIGKTTLVLAAARSCGYESLEINASRSLRSHEDVIQLRDSCRAPVSFVSLLKQESRRTCVILDEVDGSDPHAQRKILEWIRDPDRVVPILCTANEIPVILKRATEHVLVHRCMPLNARVLYESLSRYFVGVSYADFQVIVKECQFDVRRLLHRSQYGRSDKPRIVTMTGDILADLFNQEETFCGSNPIARCLS